MVAVCYCGSRCPARQVGPHNTLESEQHMARHNDHKSTTTGKRLTLARKARRAVKYASTPINIEDLILSTGRMA